MIGRTNYAAYEIRYPFVWALKYRRNGLGGAILKRLTILLNEKTQERGDYRPDRPARSCPLVWSIPAYTYLESEQARIEGIHRFYATPGIPAPQKQTDEQGGPVLTTVAQWGICLPQQANNTWMSQGAGR